MSKNQDITKQRSIGDIIYLCTICFTFIIIFLGISMSNNESEIINNEASIINEYKTLYNEGKYSESETKIKLIYDKYKDSYLLNWNYGFCLAARNDFKDAVPYYETALKINPYLILESNFLLQYGDFLSRQGDLVNSKTYILASLNENLDESLRKYAQNLIKSIDKKGTSK